MIIVFSSIDMKLLITNKHAHVLINIYEKKILKNFFNERRQEMTILDEKNLE